MKKSIITFMACAIVCTSLSQAEAGKTCRYALIAFAAGTGISYLAFRASNKSTMEHKAIFFWAEPQWVEHEKRSEAQNVAFSIMSGGMLGVVAYVITPRNANLDRSLISIKNRKLKLNPPCLRITRHREKSRMYVKLLSVSR